MEEKLEYLFNEVIEELRTIGIELIDIKKIGSINISISKRNNKRYGCCKQENPDKSYKTIIKKGRRKYINYEKFEMHNIEISPWVMELDEYIIKNTIIHELIHCIPYCNNHGTEFKKYAKYINGKLGYNISRVGNKKEDYQKSNLEYEDTKLYKYRIICSTCGQEFFRKRLIKNFEKKYRCGRCGKKFKVYELN